MTTSPNMATLAEQYLVYRRRLGFSLKIEGYLLLCFGRYADGLGHQGPITTDLAVRWARLPAGATRHYWARRLDVVRRFAKHRLLYDPDTEIPPDGLLGPSYRRPSPHIYSPPEIVALLDAAAHLDPADGLRPRTYVTLFGLLACTGIRISEALRLTRREVDLNEGILMIHRTKFYKSRLVPLHPTATDALRRYLGNRDRCRSRTAIDAFFLSDDGYPLCYGAVTRTFAALRKQLRWTDVTPVPRLLDLRHTFAVRRLLRWYADGEDIDRKIATLSTYLGHVRVSNTYWYLTAVPELLALAAARFDHFAHKDTGGER